MGGMGSSMGGMSPMMGSPMSNPMMGMGGMGNPMMGMGGPMMGGDPCGG